jgi:hypothetical protein
MANEDGSAVRVPVVDSIVQRGALLAIDGIYTGSLFQQVFDTPGTSVEGRLMQRRGSFVILLAQQKQVRLSLAECANSNSAEWRTIVVENQMYEPHT